MNVEMSPAVFEAYTELLAVTHEVVRAYAAATKTDEAYEARMALVSRQEKALDVFRDMLESACEEAMEAKYKPLVTNVSDDDLTIRVRGLEARVNALEHGWIPESIGGG